MTADSATPGYSHTQKAPLCLILYASALACFVLAWNLWGRDYVVVHRKKGVLRIGTDDAENLAGFLRKRIEL